MVAVKDKLFALVKSLTKAEKAHFSKYARLSAVKDKPDYLKLFEYLDKQEDYDEEALQVHFEGEKLLLHFSRKKNQLITKITESLGVLYETRTPETDLRRQMNQLPVLYEKAIHEKTLLKEVEVRIRAIKKMAQKHEQLHVLMELFDWERRVLVNLDKKTKEQETQVLITEQERLRHILNVELNLRNIHSEAYLILTKDIELEIAANRNKFEQLMEYPLTISEVDELSGKAKKYFYFLKSSYHRIHQEPDLAYKYARLLVDIFEKEEKKQGFVNTVEYKNQLCYYMVTCNRAGKYEDYPKTIAKIREMYDSMEEDPLLLNTMSFLGLRYYLNTYQFEEAATLADDIDRHWEALLSVTRKRRQLAYCYNITIVYWLSGNIEKAITWLSRILNFEDVKEGQRIILFARILQLPIYYDLGDENLDNRVESTRRVLAKRKQLGAFEGLVIKFFRKLVRAFEKDKKQALFQRFYAELTIFEANSGSAPHGLEEMILWCKKYI